MAVNRLERYGVGARGLEQRFDRFQLGRRQRPLEKIKSKPGSLGAGLGRPPIEKVNSPVVS